MRVLQKNIIILHLLVDSTGYLFCLALPFDFGFYCKNTHYSSNSKFLSLYCATTLPASCFLTTQNLIYIKY